LLGLALDYIEPRHRLNLLTDEIRVQVVEARHRLIAAIGNGPRAAVAVYEPDQYNAGSSLEANILFGRVTHGLADAPNKVRQVMRQTLLDLKLRDIVLQVGLGFLVGPGGKRLSQAQRQKIALARALLKQPDVLVVNRGLANLNVRSQRAIMSELATGMRDPKAAAHDGAVAGERRGQNDAVQTSLTPRPTVFWVLATPSLVDLFDRVVVFKDGEITADGPPQNLLEHDTQLKRLVA
jgi:putative ABC transport system ATP-binding protein